MKPVFQTRLRERNAPDCFRACLASLMEVETEALPDFEQLGNAAWYLAAQAFLALHGLGLVPGKYAGDRLPVGTPAGAWVIVGGTEPGGARHCHVAQTGADGQIHFRHDPYPWPRLLAMDTRGLVQPLYERAKACPLAGSLQDWEIHWVVALDAAGLLTNPDFRVAIPAAARG